MPLLPSASGLNALTMVLPQIPEDKFYCTALQSLVTSDTSLSFHELHPLLACISHIPTRLALTTQLAKHLSSGNIPYSTQGTLFLTPSADAERVTALDGALCLLQDHCQEGHGGPVDEEGLQRQLREAKVRLMLVGAGLCRYGQLAGDDAASIITSLYSELPLQEDKPCKMCCYVVAVYVTQFSDYPCSSAPAVVHRTVRDVADLHSIDVLELTSRLLEVFYTLDTHQDEYILYCMHVYCTCRSGFYHPALHNMTSTQHW